MSESTRLSVRKTYKLFVGGGFPRSESGRYRTVTTRVGDMAIHVARASRKDLRDAIGAARKAQSGWAARTAFNRGQILYRMAEMLESRAESIAARLHEAQGIDDAAAEVAAAIDRLVWYAGWTDKFAQLFSSVNPVAAPFFNFSVPEPTGVVVVFAPRNSAVLGLVSAIAPVIATGNSVVVVVDHDAPQLAIELAEVFATSDLPGGVVNLLTAVPGELVEHAAMHMDVDAIALFGPDLETRRLVETKGAETVKRVKVFDDPPREAWNAPATQSPYWMLPFIETKTAWHPIGV